MVTAVGNATNIIQLNEGIMWGIISGIATFGAQFYGANQKEKMAKTFGLSIVLMSINAFIWLSAVYLFGERILYFYLKESELLPYSLAYIRIAILALIPQVFNFSCSVMYRSMHNTKMPFIFSVLGSLLNVVLNYIFIYRLNLGVVGAAYGTLIAQLFITVLYAYTLYKERPIFFIPKEMFKLNLNFCLPVFGTMYSVIINETFFSFGLSLFNKAYGLLGVEAMDAVYIANQVFNMFTFAIWGFGAAVSIIIGTKLGEGDVEGAIRDSKYQLGVGFILGLILFISTIGLSDIYLNFFNITKIETYNNAKLILDAYAIKAFLRTFTYLMFSTLKAGGDAKILNLYDAGFMYMIGLPLAFGCVFIGIKNIGILIMICQIEQLVRVLFCLKRYNSHIWARNLTKLVSQKE